MIQLYPKGQTDYSSRGIEIHAAKAAVTYQDNGRYDLDVEMPVPDGITFDYGMILRCSVPHQEVEAIELGTVSYWQVAAGQSNVPLYSKSPTWVRNNYNPWVYGQEYSTGAKVSYDGKNYQATTDITGILTTGSPNVLPNSWTEVSGGYMDSGKTLATLNAGNTIFKTGDFNQTYMKAADQAGHEGFIEIAKCTDMSETEELILPAQTITEQSFYITEIEKSTDGKKISLHAEHVSYALGRVILGDCNLVRVNPATAIALMKGAMKEAYSGGIYTNLTEETITADWSWKNAQNAILDPKAGLLQYTTGHLIRNDLDVFLLADSEHTPRYRIAYGANMTAVDWDGSVADMVTRIYPTAQTEDGKTLLLPEEYIDTVRTVPFVRPEVLNTGLKVGTEEEQSDGTKTKLDEETVYARMREAANNRFNVDQCDRPELTLEVDWIHLPDTEEYAPYRALMNAAPGDWVQVDNGPLGISETIQLTGYTFDPILERYEKCRFGKLKAKSTVSAYDLKTGAVTGRALAAGSVGGQNIQANTITAREIEAHSITADQIASRSIVTELLAANSITADEINAGSVTAEKIAAQAITAEKIRSHSITSDQIAAGGITAAAIAAGAITAQALAADSVTAQAIAAGSIDATKIAALAITTEKLAAGAITAEKIGAGSITASKIDTNDLQALQATLQIADIASATIESADINYAQVKDLNAGSAYFGQAVIQAGLANKLYVPRLSVGYAQMIGATVGDLVVQASNGNFYAIDVDLNGNVTATQRSVSQEEITSGHTSDGRQLVMDTDILAENLTTNNLTASHALMYSITANIIDVDQLWAREAFVNKLMVQDISSNTYIQSVIGDWSGQSTITQTVNSINTRISSLGYGTVFYSTTEPDHDNLVAGDVWIEPIEDNTWDDVAQFTWDELGGMTWEQVAGQYRMYVWTGTTFKLMFDNMIVSELQTQINQNAYAITLKADETLVDALSGQVTEFGATLEVQAEQISAAVSSVNSKSSNYTRLTDPADDSSIVLNPGDTWTKAAGDGTWDGVGEFTWNELADLTWDELAGASVYTWNGSEWIQTADYGAVIQNRTLLNQTDTRITLMAEEQEIIGDRVSTNTAQISIQADRITQEVQRATNAEDGKISKTTQYQTADAIVSEAVRQSASSASGIYLAKTSIYQDADSIVTAAVRQSSTAAAGAYIAKTSTMQTADAIKNEAVRVSGAAAAELYLEKETGYQSIDDIIAQAQTLADNAATTAKNASIAKTSTYQSANAIVSAAVAQAATAAGQTYIAKTTSYQTADAIVNAAESYTNGQLTSYSTRTQTADAIADYVTDNAYKIQSGITITASGIDISGSKHVRIESGSQFRVKSSGFGVDSTDSNYVIWAGAATAANSKFRVTPGGRVTLTELAVLNADGTAETTINLRSIGIWWGNTIRSYSTDSGGYVSSMTLSNGTSVNFKSAASATLSAAWTSSGASRTYEVTIDGTSRKISETLSGSTGKGTNYYASFAINEFESHKAYGIVTASPHGGGNVLFGFQVDATSEYNAGVTSGANGVTLSAAGWVGGSNVVSASNGKSVRVNLPQITLSGGSSFSNHKTTVNASGGGASGPVASLVVDATSEYNAGDSAGYSRGYDKGEDDGYKDGYAEGVDDGYAVGYSKGAEDEAAKYTSHTGFLRGSDVVARAGGTVQTLTPINANQKVTIAGTTYYAAGTPLSVVVGAGAATTYYTSGNYLTYYTKSE